MDGGGETKKQILEVGAGRAWRYGPHWLWMFWSIRWRFWRVRVWTCPEEEEEEVAVLSVEVMVLQRAEGGSILRGGAEASTVT